MKTKQMLQHDIEQLEEYFKEYPDQDSTQKLCKIKSELKSQQYKIAVVANMSAGKSTFINAFLVKTFCRLQLRQRLIALLIYFLEKVSKKERLYIFQMKKRQ